MSFCKVIIRNNSSGLTFACRRGLVVAGPSEICRHGRVRGESVGLRENGQKTAARHRSALFQRLAMNAVNRDRRDALLEPIEGAIQEPRKNFIDNHYAEGIIRRSRPMIAKNLLLHWSGIGNRKPQRGPTYSVWQVRAVRAVGVLFKRRTSSVLWRFPRPRRIGSLFGRKI
jgi:hypothetical protein